MTAPKLTEFERNAMIEAYACGVSAKLLAKKFDVHPQYVRVAARRAGVYRSGPQKPGRPTVVVAPIVRPRRKKLIRAAGC